MQVIKKHPDTWSNMLFLVPIFLAFYYGLVYYASLGILIIIVSFLYHYSNEKKFYIADKIISYIVIVWSVWLLWRGAFEPRSFIYAIGVFVVLAIYFLFTDKGGKNEVRHSFWHLFISVITSLCILVFAL